MTTSSVDSLTKKNTEPYTAKASLTDDNTIDPKSNTVTGDRTTSLFKDATKEMGKDQFLQLLVTQLRYQDPLNPMENTEFVSQLAQFRSLESSSNIEEAIGKLSDSFQSTVDTQKNSAKSMTNSSAISMIGKTVRLKQTEVNWVAKAGNTESLRINLGDSDSAIVQLKDADGNVVKTFTANDKDSENSETLVWDGKSDKGDYVQSGKYTISIDGEDKNSDLYAFAQDTITGVRFTADGTVVKIGGKELPLDNVLDVTAGTYGASGLISPQTAVSMIGKNIRVRMDSVNFQGKVNESIPISINTGGRGQVAYEIVDKQGKTVYNGMAQAGADGVADVEWNGSNNGGDIVNPGEYLVKIAGQDQDPSLYPFAEGKVTGVMNLGGDVRLRVGSVSVNMEDIIDISESV